MQRLLFVFYEMKSAIPSAISPIAWIALAVPDFSLRFLLDLAPENAYTIVPTAIPAVMPFVKAAAFIRSPPI